MLESIQIKQENGEEVLYCYISYHYEFSKEFFENIKTGKWKDQIVDWLFKNKINFHGKKVVILASGIVIASLLLGDYQSTNKMDANIYTSPAMTHVVTDTEWPNDIEVKPVSPSEPLKIPEETPQEELSSSKPEIPSFTPMPEEMPESSYKVPDTSSIEEPVIINPITIYRSGIPVTLSLEDYVVGVVAAEMPASFSSAALQAQAVLARTYALKYVEEGKQLTDTVDTQVYYDEDQLRNMWGTSFEVYYQKVKDAVQSTEGEVLRYNGNYIDAVYHSTSNGKTEAARNVWGYEVPYLQSVDSNYDINTTFYLKTEYKDMNQILQLFGITDLQEGDIEILSRNESGRVSEVRIQNQIYQGVDLRHLLNLSSADFDLSIADGNLVITTRGWGHGVGMSQYGANGMANAGYSYDQILSHYYPGTNLTH